MTAILRVDEQLSIYNDETEGSRELATWQTPLMETFGERLARAMAAKGLNGKALSEASGVDAA